MLQARPRRSTAEFQMYAKNPLPILSAPCFIWEECLLRKVWPAPVSRSAAAAITVDQREKQTCCGHSMPAGWFFCNWRGASPFRSWQGSFPLTFYRWRIFWCRGGSRPLHSGRFTIVSEVFTDFGGSSESTRMFPEFPAYSSSDVKPEAAVGSSEP